MTTWRPRDEPGDESGDAPIAELDQFGDPITPDSTPPWRAGAPATPTTEVKRVIVEAWDDELPVPSRAEDVRDAARRVQLGFGPATRRAFNLVVFAAAVVGALAGIGVAIMHVLNDPLADTRAYYDAASRLNAGQPLYPAGIDPNSNRIYLYPPLLAVALRPLALLPYEWFAVAWELLVIAAFVALVRYLGIRQKNTWLAIGLLGVPIGWAITVAQAHVPMTLLIALGQPWSIAVAGNIKLFPVLIAIWWLGRRDFEAFFAFLMWSGLLVLAQLLLEFNGTLAYFRSVGFEQIGQVRNLSPYAQSPELWVALFLAGALVTLALARTRWGWAAAVTFATLAPPRLLVYMLMGLIAALRQPKEAGEPDPDDLSDPVAVYRRATR